MRQWSQYNRFGVVIVIAFKTNRRQDLIDLEESSFNGWYAKKVVNGYGEVICEKCGFKMNLPGGIESLNLKEHECNDNNEKK